MVREFLSFVTGFPQMWITSLNLKTIFIWYIMWLFLTVIYQLLAQPQNPISDVIKKFTTGLCVKSTIFYLFFNNSVPIREMPRYSNRRSECSSDHSTLQSIYGMSRSRSDPRINAISIIDDKYMTTSMHNLAYLNNNHPDTPSGGYDTESPRSMSVSSASSGLGRSETKFGLDSRVRRVLYHGYW